MEVRWPTRRPRALLYLHLQTNENWLDAQESIRVSALARTFAGRTGVKAKTLAEGRQWHPMIERGAGTALPFRRLHVTRALWR